MQVREIDTFAEFQSLRSDWDAAFARDPHASVFMSWPWQRGWIDVTPHPWTVLAARENDRSPCVAFLPISLRGSRSPLRIDHLREIHMAGEPTADYSGFLVHPDAQVEALNAIARHISDVLPWERLRFEEVNDPRLPEFLAHLPNALSVVEHQGTPCPRMPLPASWDEFMQGMSYTSRQSLRKRMKKAECAFRLTRFDGASDEHQIDALILLAINRTREQPDPNIWRLHSMLRHCALAGLAHMVMLWKDDTPIAGVASLINHKTKSMGLYVTAFDEAHSDYSPGRVAVALSIRDAIAMGMREYDFLRGEEPYKFQFGGVSAHNRTLIIERPTLQAALRRGISGVRESLRI